MKKSVAAFISTPNKKTFIVRRSNELVAFSGYYALPGGKVDQRESLEEGLRRELIEELEFDLNSDMVSEFYPIDSFTSPSFNPIRFETTFFHVVLKNEVDFHQCSEHQWQGYMSFEEYQEFWSRGEMLMIAPLHKMLSHFNKWGDFKNFSFEREEKLMMIEPLKDFFQISPFSNTLFPAEHTNSYVIGDLLVDPSPRESAYGEYLQKIKSLELSAIFITHHHPDHHEFVDRLSEELALPVLMSERCYGFLREKYPGLKPKLVSEGDVVSSWMGEEVSCVDISGHAMGHLGLMPSSRKWFLVGDLFQGIGTVVVATDDGNMQCYLDSLKKVIELDPKVVIPSHGIALGGINILLRTLNHRLEREAHIKELLSQGIEDKDVIFEHVYGKINEKLRPYALKTIESHIEKIKDDLNLEN